MARESQSIICPEQPVHSGSEIDAAGYVLRWWQPQIALVRLWKRLHPQRVFFYHDEKSDYRLYVEQQRQKARGMYVP